ncbi:MAG: hypothetical protein ACLFR0_07545 [Alphaproteobacteria bacterium]
MKNFERFIGIDWSGAKTPIHTKTVAVAECAKGVEPPNLIAPITPKGWSRADVSKWIKNLTLSSKRILIGIDANFGYAQEIAQAQFGNNVSYLDVWREVEKTCAATPNYFAQGFWETWPQYFWSEGKKPAHITLPRRMVENACGQAGLGWPESPFKLIGPKQVGKGGLAVMRMAYDLKKELGDKICIWPFEHEIADSAQIVISEIYPRQFLKRSGHGNAKITTLPQLNTALSYFQTKPIKDMADISDHDSDALISAAGLRWLCGREEFIPRALHYPALAPDQRSSRVEGWIFGVGAE